MEQCVLGMLCVGFLARAATMICAMQMHTFRQAMLSMALSTWSPDALLETHSPQSKAFQTAERLFHKVNKIKYTVSL